jgi:hypothetical protein
MLYLSYPGRDALVFGPRGSGKTFLWLLNFAQMIGKGFGVDWHGVLFRKQYKNLDDAILKSRQLFNDISPKAKFNSNDYTWRFPHGEELLLRNYSSIEDYYNYHGSFFTCIGMDEASSWENEEYLENIETCLRSTNPNVPRWIRNGTNPFGIGARWLYERYIQPSDVGVPFSPDGKTERVAIYLPTTENKILLENDPHYLDTLRNIKDPVKRRSWLIGDVWDFAGGIFAGIWDPHYHVIPPFPIPRSWRIYRSFDWGSASPFAVLWHAVSDGSPVILNQYDKIWFPDGHRITIGEWYGADTKRKHIGIGLSPTQIAVGIKERELAMGYAGRVRPGPADSSIFSAGVSVGKEMADHGVHFLKADKSRGSRINGIQIMSSLLMKAKQYPLEEPGWQIFNTCKNLIEQLPMLQRDENNPEDACTTGLDHTIDAARYMVSMPIHRLEIKKLIGL